MKSCITLALLALVSCSTPSMQVVGFRDPALPADRFYRRFLVRYEDDKDLVAKVAVEKAFAELLSKRFFSWRATGEAHDFKNVTTTGLAEHSLFIPGREITSDEKSRVLRSQNVDAKMSIKREWEQTTQEGNSVILIHGTGGGGGTNTTHVNLLSVSIFDAVSNSRVWLGQVKVTSALTESTLEDIAERIRIQMRIDRVAE